MTTVQWGMWVELNPDTARDLGVVDDDQVDLSNLQRQVLHTTEDVGRDKTQSAKEKIEEVLKYALVWKGKENILRKINKK